MDKKSAIVEDTRFSITDNELDLQHQEANDVMDMALNELIDSLSEVAPNESEDSCTKPDELGCTCDLRVGYKI